MGLGLTFRACCFGTADGECLYRAAFGYSFGPCWLRGSHGRWPGRVRVRSICGKHARRVLFYPCDRVLRRIYVVRHVDFPEPQQLAVHGLGSARGARFAGSLGSLARYAGMALGITVASHILYGQMSVAMGEAVTSFVAGRPDVFLFGFRSVFYVLMTVAAVGFALAMVRLVRMRARH